MKYAHLTQAQRDRIQALRDGHHEQQEIANILGVHKSTISREISGNRKKKRTRGGTRDDPCYASKTAIYEWLRTGVGVQYCRYLYSGRYAVKKRKKNKTKKTLIKSHALRTLGI